MVAYENSPVAAHAPTVGSADRHMAVGNSPRSRQDRPRANDPALNDKKRPIRMNASGWCGVPERYRSSWSPVSLAGAKPKFAGFAGFANTLHARGPTNISPPHCCPAILLMARGKSLVENRKKDFLGVTDLNLDLGDWGFSALVIPNVRRQTCFRATDGFSSVAHISSLRRALPVELPHKNVLPSGSISVHGLRAIDLPREPACPL